MRVKGGFLRMFFTDMPIKIICLTAAVVLFFFHRISTLHREPIEVALQVEIPTGLAAASQYQKNITVTLRGSDTAIKEAKAEGFDATADMSGIKMPGQYRVPVMIGRRGKPDNAEPLEITAEPKEIPVVLESLMERRVKVTADLRGSPAYGYELADYTITPVSVVIRGAKSMVQEASVVSTEAIDLTGRTGPFTGKERIVLPNALVKVVGEQAVEFNANIKEAVQAKSFEPVEISVLNLLQSLEFRTPVETGRIQVEGSQLVIEALKPEQLNLSVDCSSIHRTGTYTLRPRAEAPSDVLVLDYEPKEISVDVVPSGN